MAIFSESSDASQFAQVLIIFGIILVLYILFGVLFLVMSRLQERLQRKSDAESCSSFRAWDVIPPSCASDSERSSSMTGKDIEGTEYGFPINIQLFVRYPYEPPAGESPYTDTAILSPLRSALPKSP
ncbi:hypothetical protein C8F01DRAFT_1368921 [Mycena amicta]|nr:hypothetical protein C8F01DRAFT_1368921 [Mycena amicta]